MPEPLLQAIALRYAAGDLTAAETSAFESRLANDQESRDALAEAVRLSAAALGQRSPTPHRSFRAAVCEKLTGWHLPGFARRAYRGHPFVWAGLGAGAVAVCTVIGLSLAAHDSSRNGNAAAIAPLPRMANTTLAPEPLPLDAGTSPGTSDRDPVVAADCGAEPSGNSVAEIWAFLSTAESVEKLHDGELRWRDKLRGLGLLNGARSDHSGH